MTERPDKTAALLGLAMRAGKVAAGETAAELALRKGRAWLVILSEDASVNTSAKFEKMAAREDVPVCRFLPKQELGRCIGRGERSCAVITDEGFASELFRRIGGKS